MMRFAPVLFIVLAFCLSLSPIVPAGELPRPQTIRVVMDNNYPPFVFLDADNKVQGILVDQWRLWEQKTGVRAEIHAMDWDDALRSMQAGEYDVIDTVFLTEARTRFLDYLPPYQKIEVPIYFDREISGITGAASLKGFAVGVKAGDAAIDHLQRNGVDSLVLYNSYEAIVQAATDRKITVFVIDAPPARYFLHKMGAQERFRHSEPLYVGELHRAVRKDDAAMLNLVRQGFSRLTPQEYQEIEQKWYGKAVFEAFPMKQMIAIAAAIAAAIAVLVIALAAWNRSLRRAVAQRTAALKQSEERNRAIVEALPDLLFRISHDGTFLDCQDAEGELLLPPEQFLGKKIGAVLPPELAAQTERHLKQAIETGEMQRYEYSLLFQGIHRHFEARMVRSGAEEVLSIVRDVTERKRFEAQLIQSQKMEAVGILAAGVAHDFNNILQAIISSAHLLKLRYKEQADVQKVASDILLVSDRAAGLTRGLLAFSRKQIIMPRVVDLNESIQEMAKIFQRLLGEDIALIMNLSAERLHINADPAQIHQVLLNLMNNARDAMPTGGTLTISSFRDKCALPDDSGNAVFSPCAVLEVSDTGKGIDEKDIKHIFEPFYTTKEVGKGTGLGLSVVYGIIRQHKGTVEVTSSPDNGAAFRVALPLAHSAPEESQADEEASPKGRGETLLLVEDDESVRLATVQLLSAFGYKVVATSGGEEALDYVRKNPLSVNLALIDVIMPGMNGAEVCMSLQAMIPKLKVIFLSGYPQDVLQDSQLGDIPFLAKPIMPQSLLATVEKILASDKC
ncbi:MAG TPA: transporter substrate-binding domain-containing protein [Dissulfurispiraceae bacterium]|nr:transporter substrate-binding domain-containing protein [Dissulfurispiraceae bacterium]